MDWTTLWVFLMADIISPMVTGQFTLDYGNYEWDYDYNYDIDYLSIYYDDTSTTTTTTTTKTTTPRVMRVFDVDQDVASKACITNSKALMKKIDKAYYKCFKDFEDCSEFQKNNFGNDHEKAGLSEKYEANLACFYKKMGWVDKKNMVDREAIKKDFESLSINVKNEFISDTDACSSCNEKSIERKRRDAEENSWALSVARQRRAAGKNGDGKKTGMGGRNKGIRGNGGHCMVWYGKKRYKTCKNENNKDKKITDKKDKKESKKDKKSYLSKTEKKTTNKLLPETVYNQLWCYELSVERALENCVTEKIVAYNTATAYKWDCLP